MEYAFEKGDPEYQENRRMAMFQGFSDETNEFLWGIRLNNSREWFQPRKQIYVDKVYTPLKDLAWEVQDRMTALYPEEPFFCKVTRIYKDARMPQKDGPYKTHLWFSIRPPQDPEVQSVVPDLFFDILGGGWSVGLDYYCTRPAVMAYFRQKALEDPKPLEELTLLLQERPEFQLRGEEYKKSKGDVGPLLQPWFNKKRFYIMDSHDWESEILCSPELADRITETFQWLMPVYRYFNVPASELP